MWHTAFIAVHAGAGGIALVTGCVALAGVVCSGPIYGPWSRWSCSSYWPSARNGSDPWTHQSAVRRVGHARCVSGVARRPGPPHPGEWPRRAIGEICRAHRIHPHRPGRRLRGDPRTPSRRAGVDGRHVGRADRVGRARRAPRRTGPAVSPPRCGFSGSRSGASRSSTHKSTGRPRYTNLPAPSGR